MSLSNQCFEQHQKEQAKLQKLLAWGLLGSMGLHAIAFSMSHLTFWSRAEEPDIVPLELVVTEPVTETLETVPEPTEPAELGFQANDPGSATSGGGAPAPAVVAPLPPAPVAKLVAPQIEEAPEPVEDTQTESALEEPETNPEPETEVSEPIESQSDRWQDLLERLREIQAAGEAGSAGSASTGTETSAASTGTGSSSSSGSGSDSGGGSGSGSSGPGGTSTGVAAAPSTGDGNSQGRGSRTIACQNCVRPNYPDSALRDGVEGQPMVSVDINPDGSVRSVTLTRSSGNAAIDQAAIEAARRSRFQPIAGGASVPIEYDLTIEGSRRNRAAQQRGERQSVEVAEPTPPSPDPEVATPATSEIPPTSPEAETAEPTTQPQPPAAEAPAAPAESPAAEPATPAAPADTDEESPSEPAPAAPTPADPPAAAPTPAPAAPPPVAPQPSAPAAPPPAPATPSPAPADPLPAAPSAPPPAIPESGSDD